MAYKGRARAANQGVGQVEQLSPSAALRLKLRGPLRAAALREVALACTDGVAAGARTLGVPERTLWRWRAADSELMDAVDAARGVLHRGGL